MPTNTISTPWAFASSTVRDACFSALMSGDPTATVVESGTSIALTSTHDFQLVSTTAATPVTVTVEDDTTGGFTGTSRIMLVQSGAGTITLAPGSGVTLNSATALLSRAQYSVIALIRTDTDTWQVFGDLVAYTPVTAHDW